MAGCPVAPRCIKLLVGLRLMNRRRRCPPRSSRASARRGGSGVHPGERVRWPRRPRGPPTIVPRGAPFPPATITSPHPVPAPHSPTPPPSCSGSVCVLSGTFFPRISARRVSLLYSGLCPDVTLAVPVATMPSARPTGPFPAWPSGQRFHSWAFEFTLSCLSPTGVSEWGLSLGPRVSPAPRTAPGTLGAVEAERQKGVSSAQSPLGAGTGGGQELSCWLARWASAFVPSLLLIGRHPEDRPCGPSP